MAQEMRDRPSLKHLVQDSARFARELEKERVKDSILRVEDSLKAVHDSLSFLYIGPLRSNSPNQFLDSLKKRSIIENGDVLKWHSLYNKSMEDKGVGEWKFRRSDWTLICVFVLVFLFGLTRLFFHKEIGVIISSFYDSRILNQINREDNIITSWAFIFLYVLFGLTLGLMLYQVSSFYHIRSPYQRVNREGVNLFLAISLFVLILFTVKIVFTRLIGFVFGQQRLVRDYISVLYLSYFNAAFLLIPLLIIICLMPSIYLHSWFLISAFLVSLLFLVQLFRASNTVLKSYRFSKFYLFIYLCTLEVGPILILIKVLGI